MRLVFFFIMNVNCIELVNWCRCLQRDHQKVGLASPRWAVEGLNKGCCHVLPEFREIQ